MISIGLVENDDFNQDFYQSLNDDPASVSMVLGGQMLWPNANGRTQSLFFGNDREQENNRSSNLPITFIRSAYPELGNLMRNLDSFKYAGFGYSPFGTYHLTELDALRQSMEHVGLENVDSIYLFLNVEVKSQSRSYEGLGSCKTDSI